jgi:hypothetical protein
MEDLIQSPRWRVAVWLCMTIAVAVLATLPLLEALAGESAVADALAAGGGITISQSGVSGVDAFHAFERKAVQSVTARLGTTATARIGDFGSAGPLSLTSVNGSSPTGGGGEPRLQAAFVDHLAGHVRLLAGQLPPEGLGGGDAAVTMPQAGADQLGLHLSDRVCTAFAGSSAGQTSWCARIVGLWRPVDTSDPIWGGAPARLQLLLTGYDFFQLSAAPQAPAPAAGVRYRLDPFAIDRDQLGQVAEEVTALRHDLSGSRLRLDTSLDRTLVQLDSRQRMASSTIQLLTAALAMLALVLVAIVSRRFTELHLAELGTLRQQGWGPGWLTGLLLSRVGVLAGLALPAGLLTAGLGISLATLLIDGFGLVWLRPGDLGGAAAFLAGGLAVAGAVLWIVAHRAAHSDLNPAALTATSGVPPSLGKRVSWALVLAAAGVASLLAGSPLGPEPVHSQNVATLVVAVLPVLGVALLGVAAMILLPLTAWIPRRQRVELAGTLAGLQLEKRPDQHGWAAFLVVAGTATGGLAARAALVLLLGHDQVGGSLPGSGFAVAALACLGFAMVITIAGYGLHFLGMARRRAWEYAALFTHDPPERTVGDSVGAEQLVVLRMGVTAGLLVGLALALAAPPPLPSGIVGWMVVAAGVVVVALSLLAAAVLVGRPARHRYEAIR